MEANPEYVKLARKACDVAVHELLNRPDFDALELSYQDVQSPASEQMRLLMERRLTEGNPL